MRHKAKYGVDAPTAVRALLLTGVLLMLPQLAEMMWPTASLVPRVWRVGASIIATLLFAYAAIMLWSSLVGKMRVRDRLVDALALSTDAKVLDAGCGRGLALIACARKLVLGRAIGIDLWSSKDLSRNGPEEVRSNAFAENVADRITIETAGITQLPFEDATFDAVISMTVIHNIDTQEGRDQPVKELGRVLKPGGRLAIFDLAHTSRYAAILSGMGLKVETIGYHRLWLLPCRSLLDVWSRHVVIHLMPHGGTRYGPDSPRQRHND